jgi:hypothetical protein
MIRGEHPMTGRRTFLRVGIAATAWPLVARATHAAGIDSHRATPLLGVVYDTRLKESVAFAERSAALGLRAHAIDGDMTRLWYDEIYHRWQERPTALAGLTAHGPLFCFAELARDVRMRVVFRAEYPCTDPSTHDARLYAWLIAHPKDAGVEGVSGWLFPPV